METFETKFKNETDSEYTIWENGRSFDVVPAKSTRMIESESPLTTYARFSEVLITKDGIAVRERPGWEDPFRKGEFVLEMINVDGQPLERRLVGGMVVFLPKGIPIRVACPLTDPLIYFERLEVRRNSERVPDPRCPGYFFREYRLRDVKTPRPESEVQRILVRLTGEDLKVPPREQPQPAMEPAPYECEIENKKPKKERKEEEEPVVVRSENGQALVRLEPGQKVILEMFTPLAVYSRYKEIVFEKNGKVKLSENHRWTSPWDGRSIELINLDGAPIESMTLNRRTVYAIKGIPVVAEVALADPDIFYKSIRWERVATKKPLESFPGYTEVVTELKRIKVPRDRKEIERIIQERRAIGIEAMEEAAKRFMARSVKDILGGKK
jgi:hypothetical protein